MLRQGFVSGPENGSCWYADGLRFTCAHCGNCCSGDPGFVWASVEDCRRISAHLGLDFAEFTKRHLRRVGKRLALLERENGDCEFLVRETVGPTSCAIHPVRPVQCRTWPFWSSNLKSRKAWTAAARSCTGMNHGHHHPLALIQAALDANGDLPL